jgi:SAM-dependent methyltransferase
MKKRNRAQKIRDFISFPIRAISLFYEDKWGLSCLATERYEYVAEEVTGYCLDVGCGRHNRFINEFLQGDGKGIDVFPYEGLSEENVVPDLSQFPFPDATFDSVTFIANVNHIPRPQRDVEFSEAYRVLLPGGNIIVTMGNPAAEIMAHLAIALYDRIFKTKHDIDTERGMEKEEEYFLTDAEIIERLDRAGFKQLKRNYFGTQWGLNHKIIGWKDSLGPT